MTPTPEDNHRVQALDSAFKTIERAFGKGAIMRMDGETALDVETVPTGSLSLDLALGCGGYPRGRLVEIFGPEASGKTTLALHAIASVQKQGGTAAFIDAEHALEPRYARALGVDVDRLLVAQPDNGEQALEIAEILVRSGAVDAIVVDSVAALVPRAEIEGGMDEMQVGLQARLMSKAMRKLSNCVSRSKAILVFINQVRHKIGVTFGSNETTTGGSALRYYASVRLDIRRIGAVRTSDEIIGNRTRIRVVKNKLAPPFRTVELEIIYGKGLSAAGDLLDLASEHGLVTRNGSWYTYADDTLGQGRERVRARLEEESELRERLEQQVREAVGLATETAEAA